MKKSSYHILRVGLAITFFWIGVLILRGPESWGGLILPWAENLLPLPLKSVMISTAILDITIGFFLLIDVLTWIFAGLAALHLIVVLITVGISAVTVRDIGLFAAAISILLSSLPENFLKKGRG